jgi:predicted small secreted protein
MWVVHSCCFLPAKGIFEGKMKVGGKAPCANPLTKRKTGVFMIKRLIIGIFSFALLVLASTGCNTVHGAGEDIESVGSAISGE